ncbi:hypothetical protein [Clostridium cochlearium]|uniref:Uncharacterized protein n=1 Tax=Clostridium cochlearium TaxID=1494 RepID=A0A1G9FRQ5_CLOCO|nr:hypothetical protein [Clostridium cochlearium]MBV1818887.1 hypothetical protein [Bacteroidales bacterium MSK.15.36]NSJ91155.1 hypothetical protein [Coprococcus sp. MSK.21.13]MBE6065849.1 hypothetical protein [Clostridium cochlearium]MBU5268645.1 hypothetical protein [Clostridium cochlearium]MCG4571646.1 hypothetical protein [Clostridium cochlearium]
MGKKRRKKCSNNNGLLILILIVLQFGCGNNQHGCIDNSILFILALYYLSCCKDFDLCSCLCC